MQEFQKAIGLRFQKFIKHYSVIKCCIVPVQSTAFTLGHDQALAKLFVSQSGREKNAEDLLKDIGNPFSPETYFKKGTRFGLLVPFWSI